LEPGSIVTCCLLGNPKDNGLIPTVLHPTRTKRQTCAGRSEPRKSGAMYGDAAMPPGIRRKQKFEQER
jgi:hypothetical protein